MNKMKKITATAAAMAISAGLAVGGTLAYLNSVTETKTNTFTSGKNITTTLTETEWTADSGKDYTPGDVIRKNPVMKNESDQAVYMAIKVDYTDALAYIKMWNYRLWRAGWECLQWVFTVMNYLSFMMLIP